MLSLYYAGCGMGVFHLFVSPTRDLKYLPEQNPLTMGNQIGLGQFVRDIFEISVQTGIYLTCEFISIKIITEITNKLSTFPFWLYEPLGIRE